MNDLVGGSLKKVLSREKKTLGSSGTLRNKQHFLWIMLGFCLLFQLYALCLALPTVLFYKLCQHNVLHRNAYSVVSKIGCIYW